MIKTRCPGCSTVLRVEPAPEYRCPQCQQRFRLPGNVGRSTSTQAQQQPEFAQPAQYPPPLPNHGSKTFVTQGSMPLASRQPLAKSITKSPVRSRRSQKSSSLLWPFVIAAVVSLGLVLIGVSLFVAFATGEPRVAQTLTNIPAVGDKPNPVIEVPRDEPMQDEVKKRDGLRFEKPVPRERPNNNQPGQPELEQNPLANNPLFAGQGADATKKAKEFYREAMAIVSQMNPGNDSTEKLTDLGGKFAALQKQYGYSVLKAQRILDLGALQNWPR